MKQLPLLYLEFWDHASGNTGWLAPDEYSETEVLPQHAVGWLIREDKKQLVLVPWKNRDNTLSAVRMYIVKSTITKRRRLTLPK